MSTLFLCRPIAEFRPGLHLIREVSRSHTIRHICTTGMTPLYKWSVRSRGPYLRSTQQTQWTNIQALIGIRNSTPANKQLDQQDGRLLIYCILNSPFLNTLRSYDVINCLKLLTSIFRLHIKKECKIIFVLLINFLRIFHKHCWTLELWWQAVPVFWILANCHILGVRVIQNGDTKATGMFISSRQLSREQRDLFYWRNKMEGKLCK